MLSQKEIKHIARLARLELSLKEINIFRKELGEILHYIDKLKKVKIDFEAINKPNFLKNVFRRDEIEENLLLSRGSKDIVKALPKRKGNLAKVPAIFSRKK